jgi:hypothetical protein
MIEGVMVEGRLNKEWTETLGCNAALVFRAVFAAVSIFANDLLFVRSRHIPYAYSLLRSFQALSRCYSRAMADHSPDSTMHCFRSYLWYVFNTEGSSLANTDDTVVGIYFLVEFRDLLCTSADGFPLGLMVTVAMTAVTNIILGAMIVAKLHEARRAAQAIAEGSGRSTMPHKRRYTHIAIFVSESAILWIVTAVLNIVSTVTPSMMDMSPFFELLFAITAVCTAYACIGLSCSYVCRRCSAQHCSPTK